MAPAPVSVFEDGYFSWAPGVYCTIAWDQAVLLSVPQNKYFALPATATHAIKQLLLQGRGETASLSAREMVLWKRLRDRGLAQASRAPRLSPAAATGKRQSALNSWRRYENRFAFAEIADFLMAYAAASLRLRMRGLSACLSHIARVRSHGAPAASRVAPFEELALRYNSVRILFSKRKSECLLDTLTAFEFFAKRGVVADVVFGVQPSPVVAHAWLELDHIVLNDAAEMVEQYTEIMRA